MTEIEIEILKTAITLFGIVGGVLGFVAVLVFAVSLHALQPPIPGPNAPPPWSPSTPFLKDVWDQAQNRPQ